MFITRARAVKNSQVSLGYFRTYSGVGLPDKVIAVGRHFDNQFQVPMLFLITISSHLTINLANNFTLILSWAFVISRCFHSYIHLGSNNVKLRVIAYAIGWFFILLLWIQLLSFSF
jgi:hypothetical protein